MTREQAAHLAHFAQYPSMTAVAGFAIAAREEAHSQLAEFVCDLGERSMRPHQPGRLERFARSAARHPFETGRTCVRAAKLLPTVRQAIPAYVWPILGLATVVKMMPLDFGADETLFALAFVLIAWQRPGLLDALYREAQAGRPAFCQCPPCSARWQRKQARRAAFRHPFGTTTRKAAVR